MTPDAFDVVMGTRRGSDRPDDPVRDPLWWRNGHPDECAELRSFIHDAYVRGYGRFALRGEPVSGGERDWIVLFSKHASRTLRRSLSGMELAWVEAEWPMELRDPEQPFPFEQTVGDLYPIHDAR